MKNEIDIVDKMNCWTVVDRPTNRRVLHSKFAPKHKRDEDGQIQKYNARFVGCGNEEENNNTEYFSPVAAFTVIKIITNHATQNG